MVPINVYNYSQTITFNHLDYTDLHLVIDGVIFQKEFSAPKGISRVWRELIPRLATHLRQLDIRNRVTILSRVPIFDKATNTAACQQWSGCSWPVTYHQIRPYNENMDIESDEEMVTAVVKSLKGTVFVSTLITRFANDNLNALMCIFLHLEFKF